MSDALITSGWMPREQWDALIRAENCPLCQAVRSPAATDVYGSTILDLAISRLRLARNQFVPGYCVLICHQHVQEPYHLPRAARQQFYEDMTLAAQALDTVFRPVKMNFQLLGNAIPHLHAHLVPRYYGDVAPAQPINPDKEIVDLAPAEVETRVAAIRACLTQLLASEPER